MKVEHVQLLKLSFRFVETVIISSNFRVYNIKFVEIDKSNPTKWIVYLSLKSLKVKKASRGSKIFHGKFLNLRKFIPK